MKDSLRGISSFYDMLRIAGETFFELSQSLRHYRVSCGLFDTNLLKLIDEKDRESQLNNPLSARS